MGPAFYHHAVGTDAAEASVSDGLLLGFSSPPHALEGWSYFLCCWAPPSTQHRPRGCSRRHELPQNDGLADTVWLNE